MTTSASNAIIDNVQQHPGSVEFYYLSHSTWPYPKDIKHDISSVRIAILDSSFNPPTSAHLALAASPYPFTPSSDPNPVSISSKYDAYLLLLSVRNADKLLKPGDATYEQRLEMMHLLALSLQTSSISNVAIAVIDEPMFVRKSKALKTVLSSRIRELSLPEMFCESMHPISNAPVHLFSFIEITFLLGFDTLERLFAPRYYPSASEEAMYSALHKLFDPVSEGGEGTKVVCAFRGQDDGTLSAAERFLQAGCMSYIHLSSEISTLSSTNIRLSRKEGNENWRVMVPPPIEQYIVDKSLYL